MLRLNMNMNILYVLIANYDNIPRKDIRTNLVGQAVQRARQAVHGGAEGQVGVRQSAAHQVASVGTDVPSLVVTAGGSVTQSMRRCF